MEARLLYPSGRRTPALSPLLGSVVPALLPRMSRVELEMLGAMRGPVSPTVLPAGAPPDLLVSQVRVRAQLVRFYLDLLPGLDRTHRNGIDALCDVATVLHLERWIQPAVASETMRPLRQLVGPEEELGFGPSYDEVLDVLHGIADFTGSAQRVQAVTQAWVGRPEVYWDGIADAFLATAAITGRQSSLRMVTRVTAVSSATVRRSPVFRATRLRAAAVILADVVEEDLVAAASEPWLAGIAAGPTLA
ncbi:hypothetical protein ASC77_11130 [Nocardioides sp. Root1257]|uniref:hypothetical protein n=1 Tax=unclassified Nocardioides TaxID=2615069 RepID=UPI0006F2EF7E|nr:MULTISPECIES: hypothetical protein [unclassified Nocardioides]KQW49234.1 hypothetical protein ASC77_11130 [Nocardioides sp. Root1257]KRC48408.1 hypothetical protein ASE24_11135 [Nocardioides sp. Root224]